MSDEIRNIITYANEEAIRLGNFVLTTDHLILGIIRHGNNLAVEALIRVGLDIKEIKHYVEKRLKSDETSALVSPEKMTLSKAAERAVQQLLVESKQLKVAVPTAEHLLLAILWKANWSYAMDLFQGEHITYYDILSEVLKEYGKRSVDNLPDLEELKEMHDKFEESQERGKKESEEEDKSAIDGLTINKSGEKAATEINEVLQNSNREGLENLISDAINNGGGKEFDGGIKPPEPEKRPKEKFSKSRSATPNIDKFGYDLTKAAADGKLDPVVGRKDEIERLAQILGRRKKNNPVLIGEPGVGKSAIVEGLAIKIANKEISKALRNKRIISIDMGSLVAGTIYRGQFEERIKSILKEISNRPEIILFIDELHTLVGAGNSSGSLDAANMLKPALARGELQCIGATTLDEYREFIEKDGALERRFQKIMVEATDYSETLSILEHIKGKYEEHHNVIYTEEALKMCINLSERYITDRMLPDKAIDILDEAGSRVHLKNLKTPKRIIEKEEQIATFRQKKLKAAEESDFEKAAMFRDLEHSHTEELTRLTKLWEKRERKHPSVVDKEEIAEALSLATKIPVNKIAESEGNRLMNMQKILSKHIVGQDSAIEKITKAIQRNRAGLKDPDKPIGTFLFLGPTGVGKTQLAKQLAQYMFDTKESLIRIDMSEYMEKHSVSRLIGAPPGYVGYEEGGELSERVRRKPYSVVLLDEIEKAHPDIFNLLLQVLDEGRLTDSNGRRVDFRNTVLIMTSNIGTRELKEYGNGLGFSNATKREPREKQIIEKAIQKTFTPEFINRLDEQILFNSLSAKDLEQITEIELKSLYTRVEHAGYTLKITQAAKKFVAEEGYDIQFGARPLKRAIQRYIEDPVAEAIISKRVKTGDTITITMNRDRENPSTIVK